VKRVSLALFTVTALYGQTHNTLTPEEKAAGWRLLFDGQTMNGWTNPQKMNPPGDSWAVEDGCLRANPHPRIREDLLTLEVFTDFDLTFEWRISPGGNSGLKYRIQDTVFLDSSKTPKGKRFEETVGYEMEHRLGKRAALPPDAHSEDYPVGFEFQTIDNEGHADGRRGGSHASGALYDMVAPAHQMAKPVGEFNQARILLRGNHVEHWLNGVKVVDARLDSPEVEKAVAARWKGTGVYELLTKQPKKACPIGLQNHNDVAWFREIKIRPLPPMTAAEKILDRLRTLRQVPDDQRGAVTAGLAREIRGLAAGPEKLRLALDLANLSTEGDFGRETLSEVATTLRGAVQEQHPIDEDAYMSLAQLARYEGVSAAVLGTPEYRTAVAKLEALDARRKDANFTLTDLRGHSWTLRELKGNVVLVNFWATWCPPCRKEMPDLEALYKRFHDRGLVVLAISDEDEAKVRNYITEKAYTFPILLDPGRKVNEAMGVEGIPKSFVYDREGRLVAQAIDMRTQTQFLAMLRSAGLE
jgi:peroxiredoxin